jgi:hypothetical protein
VRDPGRAWWSEATASTMDATLDTHTFTMADDCCCCWCCDYCERAVRGRTFFDVVISRGPI